MELASGYKAYPLPEEVLKQYNADLTGSLTDFVKIEPDGWILPKRFLDLEKQIYNFKFRPDDVVVMSYPKCGSTWTQEIVWNMRKNPNLDNPAQEDALLVRSPLIEFDQFTPRLSAKSKPEFLKQQYKIYMKGYEKYVPDWEPSVERGLMFDLADTYKGGRVLKTHLPFSLVASNLLDTCKVIYVTRNVKDQVLSAEHHYRWLPLYEFKGTLDTFIDYYTNDSLTYGSYGKHVRQAWERKEHQNFLLLFFEDMKADTMGTLKKIDEFLGTGLSDEQLNNVLKASGFKTLKGKEQEDLKNLRMDTSREIVDKEGFMFHKGQVGSWKGRYTPQQEAKLDEYIQKHFGDLDINFKYQ